MSEQRENLGPADELGDLRQQLFALKQREGELREYLIAHPEARHGKRYVAEIRTRKVTRIDTSSFKHHYPEIYAEFALIEDYEQLHTVGISEDGEPLSMRKVRKLEKEQANGQ